MSTPTIKTQRLIAHRPTQNDLAFFRTIHTDIGTMATLSADGSIVDEETSQNILAKHITHWDDHNFGVWLFEQSSDQEAIGYCGLRNCGSLDPPEIELFFGVRSQFFNNGFGTEMARAVVTKGFRDLNFKRIVGFTFEGNFASRALMTKIGMSYVGVVEHSGMPHCYYRLVHPGG